MDIPTEIGRTAAVLRRAGCVAAEEEAVELVEAAAGDPGRLRQLVGRRCQGEPLAWLVGSVRFCGEKVLVHPGVYVPRWQTEPLALEAAKRLPNTGIAVDFCTGSGAIAVVLQCRHSSASIVATENDPLAVACARANGVEVYEGDMSANLPAALSGVVDVVTAVVPYVPTDELRLLPRDVTTYEPRGALDGGADGTTFLVCAAAEAVPLLRAGGSLLLELGGDEAAMLEPVLTGLGYRDVELLSDDDDDVRALICRH
ncbi:MAG: putative protein N(5)-glutamine methyltransferase [Acidimicrobiales bacterium]